MAADRTFVMLRIIILGVLMLKVNSLPITSDDGMEIEREIEQPENIDELNKVLDNVAYVNNFKNMMAGYVQEQYSNLTIADIDKIKDVLEDFCHQFAKDLKEILQRESVAVIESVDDGIPETTFDEIKGGIKREYPLINERKADEVMSVLRRNLFETRKRIDTIITERNAAGS